jgi:hypothetical protein
VNVTLVGGATKQVNIMKIGASGVNAFVGVGGPYFVDSNDDGVIDENDTPASDGAMGFVLSNLEFGLALMKPTALGDTTSYYAVKASGGAEIVGVTGITIRADALDVAINGASAPATGGATPTAPPVVDFQSELPRDRGPERHDRPRPRRRRRPPAPSVLLDFDSSDIKASGEITLAIDGFVYVSGLFEFRKSGAPQQVTLTNGTSKTVNVLTVGASHVNAFVGTGEPGQ